MLKSQQTSCFPLLSYLWVKFNNACKPLLQESQNVNTLFYSILSLFALNNTNSDHCLLLKISKMPGTFLTQTLN